MGLQLNDVSYTLRQIRRNPWFALSVVGVLAAGIGANAAIFSVLYSLVLRPLPYPSADRLFMAWERNVSQGIDREGVSGPNFLDWRERSRTVEDIAVMEVGTGTLTGFGEPQQLPGLRISPNLLSMVGARAHLGRLFDQSDAAAGSFRNNALLTYDSWMRLGGDPSIIGRQIQADLQPYTVVGVLTPDFWVPVRCEAVVAWPDAVLRARNRGSRDLTAIVRLRPGVSQQQAEAELNSIASEIDRSEAGLAGWGVRLEGLQGTITSSIRPALLVLFGAVALALLIGCANIANLLLARSLSRRREIALRSALGAGQPRIVRQLLTESATLGLIGGAFGCLLAWWLVEAFTRLAPSTVMLDEMQSEVVLRNLTVDPWILAVALLSSLVCGLLFGLVPALQVGRADLQKHLREGERGSSSGHLFWRQSLLGVQVAVTLLLLAGCGAFLASFLNLRKVNPGFTASNAMTFEIELPTDTRYQKIDDLRRFYRELDLRLKQIPGAQSAGLASILPLAPSQDHMTYSVLDGRSGNVGQRFGADRRSVTQGFFEALKIPLVRGRLLQPNDDETRPLVAVVDQTFAARHWPGENPIGQRLLLRTKECEIVGVVGPVRHGGLSQAPNPTIYFTAAQMPANRMSGVIRASASEAQITQAIKETVWSLDKDMPVYRVQPMQSLLDSKLQNPRLTVWLVSAFALAALLLSALGTYAVVAYQTTCRLREFGIRLALGSSRAQILRLVLTQTARTLAIALPAGLLLAWMLGRSVGALLYGISPADPRLLLGAGGFLALVAMVASLFPALRAASRTSLASLRSE